MKPLIIDVGSYALKLGFGGEFAPRVDIPLVVGKVRDDINYMMKKRIFKELNIRDFKREYFFGHEAMYLRNFLDLQWISNGRTILDDFFFNIVLEYAIDLLKISFTNQAILISQPFYSDIVNHIGQTLYSAYNAYEIIPAFQPLLNFLAAGLKTGLVVDIGHYLTQITPMINGVIVADGVRVVDLGGKDITDILLSLLMEKGAFVGLKQSSILSKNAIADMIKEIFCYVSRNPADELEVSRQKENEINFPLLYNESVQIGDERFLAPESLFMPQKENVEPIDNLIFDIVSRYESPIQQAFLENILLTGGTSLLPGLIERLYEALVHKFIDFNYKINIFSFAQFGSPRYATFFGAAKLAATDIDSSITISRMDYEYKGTIEISTSFMEQFNEIFNQTSAIKLKPIIVSVKNFYNRQLYQQIYNIVNTSRETPLNEIGNKLQRSPIELYQVIETLLSYNILEGEFRGDLFINSQYREEVEKVPVQVEAVKSKPKIQKESPKKDLYVPSFQKLDAEMPSQVASKDSVVDVTETPQYEYTYQKIDTEMKEKWAHDPTILSGKKKSIPKREVIKDIGGTFKRIDATKAEEYAKDPTIIKESQTIARRKVVQKPKGYTYEKIDQEMADKWAKDETIITEGKKPKRAELLLPVDEGPSYLKVDNEMKQTWKESGLVSIPKRITPKGFFEQPATRSKDDQLREIPTFLQIKDQVVPQSSEIMIEDLLKPKITSEISTHKKSKIPSFVLFGGKELTEDQLKQIKKFEEEERRKKEKEEKLL